MTFMDTNSFGRKMHRRHVVKRQDNGQFSPSSISVAPIGSSTDATTTPTQAGQAPTPPTTTRQTPTPTQNNNPPANQNTDTVNNGLPTDDTATQTPANTITTTSSTSTSTTSSTTSLSTSSTPTSLTTPLTSHVTVASVTTSRIVAPAGIVSSVTPSASSTATPTAGLSTGSIVGIAAGGLLGFGVLVTIGLWLIKRVLRKKDDDDVDGYLRNSVHVADENDDGTYFNQPRPPTMIERHFGAAGIGAHGNFNFGGHDMGVPPLPPPAPVNPFQTPLASPAASDHNVSLDDQTQHRQYMSRSPSLTRYNGDNGLPQLHIQTSYEEQPDPLAQGHYADLQRGSITPYQAAQYAEISRQLNNAPTPTTPSFDMVAPPLRERVISPPPTLPELQRVMSPQPIGAAYNYSMPSRGPASANNSHAQLVSIPEGTYTGHEGNAQYGFHHTPPTSQGLLAPPSSLAPGQRPVSQYDEEDAYGGM